MSEPKASGARPSEREGLSARGTIEGVEPTQTKELGDFDSEDESNGQELVVGTSSI